MGQGLESRAYGRARDAADIFRLHPSRRPRRTFRLGSERVRSGHAAASVNPSRNSAPLAHMRHDGDLRAMATMARRRPLVVISPTPQAFRLDQVIRAVVLLAGLEAPRRQPEVGLDGARALEAGRMIDRRLEAEGGGL